MSNLILQHILSGKTLPVQKSGPNYHPPTNPFLRANGSQYGENSNLGLNQPLRNPMFVGYRDNKPIYAGSRLFVLY